MTRHAHKLLIWMMAAALLLALPLSGAYAQCAPPESGLIAEWKMDDNGGSTTAAETVGSYDATQVGSLTFNPTGGEIDGAVTMPDLAGNYLSLPNNAAIKPTLPATISFWYKPGTTPVPTTYFVETEDWAEQGAVRSGITMEYDGTYLIIHYGDGAGAGTSNRRSKWADYNFTTTNWYHIVGVIRGQTDMSIYVNGVDLGTGATGGYDGASSATDVVYTGTYGGTIGGINAGSAINGAIDDVRFYNRALSPDEVTALYTTHATGSVPAGTMVYDSRHSSTIYCNGINWVHAGTGSYNPDAVDFDGANDYLTVANLTGIQDSDKWTASFWINLHPQVTDTGQTVIISNSGHMQIIIDTVGTNNDLYNLYINGTNASLTDKVYVDTGEVLSPNTWYNVLFSYDGTSGNTHLYLNDVDNANNITNVTGNIDFTNPPFAFGSETTPGAYLDADIADFWMDAGTYIDFSVPANRRKFISAAGMPMYLGSDGSIPTGSKPTIFLAGDDVTFSSNLGTGGGFTVNGALTFASSQPADKVLGTSDPCNPANSPSPGQVCDDGSVYAGISPDGNLPMYTESATVSNGPWSTGTVTTPVTTGINSTVTGAYNTAELAYGGTWQDSDSGTAGIQGHEAADYCANLTANNHSNWYLPALNELQVLYFNSAAIGNFNAGEYWSSSEDASIDPSIYALPIDFVNGSTITYRNKFDFRDSRCVYKGYGCSSPYGAKGQIDYSTDFHVMMYCNGAEWVAMGPMGAAAPTSGLIGHWKLDDTSGNAIDSAGSNDLTANGSPTYGVTGQLDSAISFVSTSGDKFVGTDTTLFDGLTAITVSAWVKFTTTGFGVITTKGQCAQDFGDFELGINGFNQGDVYLAVWWDANNWEAASSADNYNDGQWHLVTGTFDDTNIKLYVDGSIKDVTPATTGGTGLYNNGFNYVIGACSNNNGGELYATTDDVRIYNRALSSDEVKALYTNGMNGGQSISSGNCSSPSMPEGSMFYNVDHNVAQYCNGSNWIGMGQ